MDIRKEQIAHEDFLMSAYKKYITIYHTQELEPRVTLLKYDFSFLDSLIPLSLGGQTIKDTLRELTNLLNGWKDTLEKWHAWNIVLDDFKDDYMQVWELEAEFVELIIYKCLFMPSSMRDTFTSTGIESFHQARLATDSNYKDSLPYDPVLPDLKPVYLSRRKKEKIFQEILEYWNNAEIMSALRQINTQDYSQNLTKDYRNLSSHNIAPRITNGYTKFIKRSIVKAEKLVAIGNGCFEKEIISNKKTVQYCYSGTEPLNRKEIFSANLDEFYKARTCFLAYKQLLVEISERI